MVCSRLRLEYILSHSRAGTDGGLVCVVIYKSWSQSLTWFGRRRGLPVVGIVGTKISQLRHVASLVPCCMYGTSISKTAGDGVWRTWRTWNLTRARSDSTTARP